MIVNVDEEGKKAVVGLCDIALRNIGIRSLESINIILSAVKELPAAKDEGPDDEPDALDG